jgi:hypothetical protein
VDEGIWWKAVLNAIQLRWIANVPACQSAGTGISPAAAIDAVYGSTLVERNVNNDPFAQALSDAAQLKYRDSSGAPAFAS